MFIIDQLFRLFKLSEIVQRPTTAAWLGLHLSKFLGKESRSVFCLLINEPEQGHSWPQYLVEGLWISVWDQTFQARKVKPPDFPANTALSRATVAYVWYAVQLDAFRKLYHNEEGDSDQGYIENNWRPTQPLNGRTVYRSYQTLGLLLSGFCSIKIATLQHFTLVNDYQKQTATSSRHVYKSRKRLATRKCRPIACRLRWWRVYP